MCCQVEVSATNWSLVQRSPTDCGASLCVIKKPRKRGGSSLLPGCENTTTMDCNARKTNKQSKGLLQQAEVAQGVPGTLRPRIFLTFRHYKGGRSSVKRTGRLYPRGNPWYSLSEAESTSGHMVLSGEPRKKSPVTPSGIDPGTVRLVAQCLSHYATPGPILY